MAKPKRIILVRHGQSEGNADDTKEVYGKTPDYALNLSPRGRKEAYTLGGVLMDLIGKESVQFYRSPFYRTRQTHEELAPFFPGASCKEDIRLREQERNGRLEPHHGDAVDQERDAYGHFYYRFQGGESCADVFDRISSFLDTLHRDFEKAAFPDNAVIVAHGMTNRVFLMRFLHYTVEEFEFLRNPKNCGMYVLELRESFPKPKYHLTEEPARYEKRTCIH
jgi:broad specificity phosphatase PhoE